MISKRYGNELNVVLVDIKGKERYRVSHVEMHVSGSGPLNPDFHTGMFFRSVITIFLMQQMNK